MSSQLILKFLDVLKSVDSVLCCFFPEPEVVADQIEVADQIDIVADQIEVVADQVDKEADRQTGKHIMFRITTVHNFLENFTNFQIDCGYRKLLDVLESSDFPPLFCDFNDCSIIFR